MQTQEHAILGLFAHPDDEQLMSGVLAACAHKGIRTGLVCATRGEVGQIADPALASPETLGQVREAELRAATAVLGVRHLWFLDYRDSGMMGMKENEDPRSFVRCDPDEALAKIVRIVREFRPTVMVTFDETGGYGHPDHFMINRLATEAFSAAADARRFPEAGEPWQAMRLYYVGFPRSLMREFTRYLQEQNIRTDLRDIELEQFGLPDERITNVIDVSRWLDVKRRSLNQHRTQLGPDSPFAGLSDQWWDAIYSKEYYALVAGVPLPDTPQARGDLFAGITR